MLFDKVGLAEQITLTVPSSHQPLARLTFVVEEGIRLLGMLMLAIKCVSKQGLSCKYDYT